MSADSTVDVNRPDTNFGNAAADYATHRQGFPDAFFDELFLRGLIAPGRRALDLGTGTGTLALGLAARGVRVDALDRSADMIAQASAQPNPGERIAWHVGRAEDTGLVAGAYDLVIAGQCWHWFDQDAAAAEARRLLAPGGHLVVARYDFLQRPGEVVEASLSLIDAWCPRHQNPWYAFPAEAQYPAIMNLMVRHGFAEEHDTFSVYVDDAYTPEGWRGRIRASGPIGGTLPPEQVAAFDEAHATLLASRFGERERYFVPHRAYAVAVRSA